MTMSFFIIKTFMDTFACDYAVVKKNLKKIKLKKKIFFIILN
jgi:hypothetical protein